jgi:hypothetical protein
MKVFVVGYPTVSAANHVTQSTNGCGMMREKWDQLHGEQTYGEMTIDKALSEPSSLYCKSFRGMTVNLFNSFGTNHQPLSISYMVSDQKPSTGGV